MAFARIGGVSGQAILRETSPGAQVAGVSVVAAQEMVDAVEKAGVANMVSFNYRRVPAITLFKQLIDEGRVGRPFTASSSSRPRPSISSA